MLLGGFWPGFGGFLIRAAHPPPPSESIGGGYQAPPAFPSRHPHARSAYVRVCRCGRGGICRRTGDGFGPGSGGFLIRAACRFWPSAARMFASPAGSESRVLRVKCAFASMRQTTSTGAGGFPIPDQKTPESGTAAVGACRNPARPPTPVVPAGGVADSLAWRMGTVHLPRSGIDMPAAPPGVASTPARVRT